MPSAPEAHFTLLWQAVGGDESGLPLTPEHRWHPTRKWRADFALLTKGILFEVEGGVHSGGRHSRGTGFTADAEKYLEATLAGWTVVRLVPSQLNYPTLEKILTWTQTLPNQPSPPSAFSPGTPDGNGSPPSAAPGKLPSRKPSSPRSRKKAPPASARNTAP